MNIECLQPAFMTAGRLGGFIKRRVTSTAATGKAMD